MSMDIPETLGWIALGFVPTLVAMEVAWRLRTKERHTGTVIEGRRGAREATGRTV
jgi:hypothetical protein